MSVLLCTQPMSRERKRQRRKPLGIFFCLGRRHWHRKNALCRPALPHAAQAAWGQQATSYRPTVPRHVCGADGGLAATGDFSIYQTFNSSSKRSSCFLYSPQSCSQIDPMCQENVQYPFTVLYAGRAVVQIVL